MATIAAQFIIEFTIRRWDKLTGGVEGMYVEPGSLGPLHFDDRIHLYYLTLILAVAATLVLKNIIRSRSGRAFVAIRDRYLAAEVIGVNVFKYRLMSFAAASFFAGVAGALVAQNLEVITHESFTIPQSVDYLAMCIIGGLGHILGGIFGVAFWFILERILEIVTTSLNSAYPGSCHLVRFDPGNCFWSGHCSFSDLRAGWSGGSLANHQSVLEVVAVFILTDFLI